MLVHGYGAHLKAKATRCRSSGPARPYSGSKNSPCGQLHSTGKAQSGEKEKKQQVVGIEWPERMGDRQKEGERSMKSPKETESVNQGQSESSKREKQRYRKRDLENGHRSSDRGRKYTQVEPTH